MVLLFTDFFHTFNHNDNTKSRLYFICHLSCNTTLNRNIIHYLSYYLTFSDPIYYLWKYTSNIKSNDKCEVKHVYVYSLAFILINLTPVFLYFSLFRSPKSLLCVIPDVSVYSDSWRCFRRIITLPLSLIRTDGLIYRTSYSFTYTPELHLSASSRGAAGGREGGADGGQEDGEDILLETIHQEFTRTNFHLFMQS